MPLRRYGKHVSRRANRSVMRCGRVPTDVRVASGNSILAREIQPLASVQSSSCSTCVIGRTYRHKGPDRCAAARL